MSNSATLTTTQPPVAGPSAAAPRPRHRTRARFWLLLLLAAAISLASYPPPWQAAVRAWLVWQAGRQGCDLSVDAIAGGPFDPIHLYGIHCRQRDLPATADAGTDLRVAHAEVALAWTLPWRQRAGSSWIRQITLDGVRGQWDLSARGHRSGPTTARSAWLDAFGAKLVPADFLLRAADATLRRGRYHLRVRGMILSGNRDDAGHFAARAVEVGGPHFNATLPDQHCQTLWQGDRLALSNLDLGHGILLARATLDGTHLARQRLDWDGDLHALGGTVRGQGAVNFSRARLALEVGGSLQNVTLGPLAGLMEITGPADGQVEQATFSFRGDPENWPAAEMWLAGRATAFRWGQRRWESLEMQAVVTNHRVQVHRLELRQDRNWLSLNGECSLPPDPQAAANGAAGRWWQAGFACNVDARLEDLHALAQLFGPPVPPVAGRMSINGRLSARPGTQGYDGYLNVEGSRLVIRGAPLDFVRSTLIFRGEELDVADLQATRGGDYLTGRGSIHLAGPPDFQALGRVSVEDLGVYAPAYAGLLPWGADTDAAPIRALTAGMRLDGSVLHFDQCQGEQAGNTFNLAGSVDLRDAGNPVLDLALTGQEPPRAADPLDADALWRAGVSYALNLRGPLAGGMTIQGDVQLMHGHFDGPGELRADTPATPLGSRLLQPLLRRLPGAWRDRALDLHVTAANPLPSGKTGREGQVTPDLDITGTGRQSRLGGKLAFRSISGPEQESGAWYFSPDEPDNPTASITATSGDGRRSTYYYGPRDRGQTLSWDLNPPDGGLTLQPAETRSYLAEDASPWNVWKPVPGLVPETLLPLR